MPVSSPYYRRFQTPGGYDAGRLLKHWLEKMSKTPRNRPRRDQGEVDPGVASHSRRPDGHQDAGPEAEIWREWLRPLGEAEQPLGFHSREPAKAASWQLGRVQQALVQDFRLPLGLAAPEVIILTLPPLGDSRFQDCFGEAWKNACLQDLPEGMLQFAEKPFWTPTSQGLKKICIFPCLLPVSAADAPAAPPEDPVLVVMGAFQSIPFPDAGGDAAGGLGRHPNAASRTRRKPFTRHDASMRIFHFTEALLSASRRGLASLLAPSALCSAPEAVGLRRRWATGFDRVYAETAADSAIYQIHKQAGGKKPGERNLGGREVFHRALAGGGWPDMAASCPPAPADKPLDSFRRAFPRQVNKFSFLPPPIPREYLAWASVADLSAAAPVNGLMEKRGGALIDIDREVLEKRLRAYFDPTLGWPEYAGLGLGLTERQANFRPEEARSRLIKSGAEFRPGDIRPYAFKPFDNRHCYYAEDGALWNDPRPELARQCRRPHYMGCDGFILTRPAAAVEDEGVPFFFSPHLTDGDLLRGHAYCIPMFLPGQTGDPRQPRANLSPALAAYLKSLEPGDAVPLEEKARLVWGHVLAMGFSPAYLAASRAGLGEGWPRIPFPIPNARCDKREAFGLLDNSSLLGQKIMWRLSIHSGYAGQDKPEYPDSEIAVLSAGDPAAAGILNRKTIRLNANWGHEKTRSEDVGETRRKVMPGTGRLLRRPYANAERRAVEELGWKSWLRAGAVYAALGTDTCDIYLNRDVYWRNVPAKVWEYRVGGYQVLKKWLSYRESSVLKRALRREEIAFFGKLARNLAKLRLLESALDANFALIRDCGGDPARGAPEDSPKSRL